MKKIFYLTLILVSVNSLQVREVLANNSLKSSAIAKQQLSQNNPESLEESAKEKYETGKTLEAIPLLEKAINNYRAEGNINKEALALRNLALVYQQLGQWKQTEETINEIITLLPKIIVVKERKRILAQTLDVRGQLELSLDRAELAFKTWQEAANNYQQIDEFNSYANSKIYQAQALQERGFYGRAIKTLTLVSENLNTEPDSLLKAKALQSMGDVLRRVGKYQESAANLQASLAIAEKFKSNSIIADTLIGLGNTARLQQQSQTAVRYYQKAIAVAPFPEQQVLGKLDLLGLLIAEEELSSVTTLVPEIENLLIQLAPSSVAIDARIKLARMSMQLKQDVPSQNLTSNATIIRHLTTAISLARELGDKRGESEATGNLGTLYEREQRLSEARELTEQALLMAQTIDAADLSYQWQWQLGRIFRATGEREKAIAAYTESVNSLSTLRSDLVAISSEVQFSFRENVEPVYRQLVDLLLQPSANITQKDLKQARAVIESLQIAELDNFFRDACLDAKPIEIDRLDKRAAILYTVILSDRLEVIAALPNRPLRHYTTKIEREDIEIELTSLVSSLKLPERQLNLRPLQQVYRWLIAPLERDLAADNIETIVFIPDDILRNVPPTVLHDGDRYLIEKYNIAIAPSLQLVDPQPLTITKRELLLAGVTKARQGFAPLPGVAKEVKEINTLYPAEVLLNSSFTENNFNQTIEDSNYGVVHLATHGKFSSNLEDTFVLTWDERIKIDELNRLISADRKQVNPIELLVLSACETATGDRRAALGLAGIAVRAGARSTLASLWTVSDEATVELMSRFYEELNQKNSTKAEALRQAQQQVLQNKKFSHPYFWSAFILLGNWL
jgi:CHAT domain-containing protein